MFVDYEKGRDDTTCGQSSTPCKTLSVAVNRSPDQGTINVCGNQYLNETIQVDKSLTIQGDKDSAILPHNKIMFAFKIPQVSVNVSFISLRFEIGLFNMDRDFRQLVSISFNNCHFHNLKGNVILAKIFMASKLYHNGN